MKNLNSFKKIIGILILFVLLFFVAQYFLYRDIKNKNEKVSLLEHDISLQDNRQEYSVSMQKLIESLSSDLTDIDNSIVPVGGDVGFIENIESIAKANGLKINIDSLVFEDSPSFAGIKVTAFRIKTKASGSWVGTYSFLKELESLPVKVRIDKFAISNTSSESGVDTKKSAPQWQSAFEIVVLKYK